jgi:hypothetical protein
MLRLSRKRTTATYRKAAWLFAVRSFERFGLPDVLRALQAGDHSLGPDNSFSRPRKWDSAHISRFPSKFVRCTDASQRFVGASQHRGTSAKRTQPLVWAAAKVCDFCGTKSALTKRTLANRGRHMLQAASSSGPGAWHSGVWAICETN